VHDAASSRAVGTRRILEIGTAFGYSAAWLAFGPQRDESIRSRRMRRTLKRPRLSFVTWAWRIECRFTSVGRRMPWGSSGHGSLPFYDAGVPMPRELAAFRTLLQPEGRFVASNLILGRYDPAPKGAGARRRYRRPLFDQKQWLTTFADPIALSVRL
jgi:hypothetical protein